MRMMIRYFTCLLAINFFLLFNADELAAFGATHTDTLTVADIFNDHMVLQRDQAVNVWGTAGAGAKISVRFGQSDYNATADASGQWRVQLRPMKAGGPFEMVIAGDNQTIRFEDVFLGDVWLASGQSNMAFRFASAEDPDKERLRQNAGALNIRTYEVAKMVGGGKRLNGRNKPWAKIQPSNIDEWSAVAFYFAKELYKHLNVPIGIINCNQGGSRIEAWMSREALKKTGVSIRTFDGIFEYYKDPYVLYEEMLTPIIPYSIKGVLWYQGEANEDNPVAYQKLLSAMIRQWREEWDQKELPFLIAQLPGFDRKTDETHESWAQLRRSQQVVAELVPQTGMVVLIDVGEKHNIHPKNKKIPGERLALAARAVAYDEAVDYSGPMPKKIRYNKKQAIITYRHVDDKLIVRGDTLSGFYVLDKTGQWHPAQADLRDDRVQVSYAEEILGVRYGWANAPDVNLFNDKGLPAAPFLEKK